MTKGIVQLHDEAGNKAFFREDVVFSYQENLYAVMTHVDEEGQDLSEESVLFAVTDADDEAYITLEPVQDEALIAEIEIHLQTLFAH